MADVDSFEAWERIDGDRTLGLVLLCDHAKRRLPADYRDLGLPPGAFDRHIAFDIGAETLTREIAGRLRAPAVLAGFSRLLIDPNRGEDDPTLVRQLYDGQVVPGNYPLDATERALRLARFYRPYHAGAAAEIAAVAAASARAPLIVSIHSFTPRLGRPPRLGPPRPWHVGVLWDADPRAALPLIEALRREPGLVVGDNEPYDGALRGDTLFRHATLKGFANALIEVRQDLIADQTGAVAWGALLSPLIDAVNRRTDIHRAQHFGSRTGPTEEMEP